MTITLDESLVAALAAAAEEEGVPLSRLVAGAAERELRLRADRAVVQEWRAEHGGFTPEELAAARAEMAEACTTPAHWAEAVGQGPTGTGSRRPAGHAG